MDFVSPENLDECWKLTQEFRVLPDDHRAKEDKLQVSVRAAQTTCTELLGKGRKRVYLWRPAIARRLPGCRTSFWRTESPCAGQKDVRGHAGARTLSQDGKHRQERRFAGCSRMQVCLTALANIDMYSRVSLGR